MTIREEPAAKLQVSRTVRAPLARVFTAWIEPALLQQWWGPDDVTTHELTLDPNVGGQLLWTLGDTDGSRVTVRGEVFDVVRNERISFTWMPEGRDWPHESRVYVDLREHRGVEIRITHDGLPDKRAYLRHQEGWTAALGKLERVLVGPPQVATTPKPMQMFTLQQKRAPLRMREGGQR